MNNCISKQYGKYTLDDINNIISLLPVLQELNGEMFSLITQKPHRLRELLGKNFYWSEIYQYSLLDQTNVCLECMGILQTITELSQSSGNANSKVIEFLHEDSRINSSEKDLPDEQIKSILTTSYSLLKTVESIQIHGQLLNQLILQVEGGNDNALFKIIEIDHSAMSCPCIADRIALAELEQDKLFFDSLKKALNCPHKTKQSNYRELRYLLEILDEDQTLSTLSMEQLYQLCCVDIELYPIEGSNPAKSLDQFARRWKSERST
ncbi:MAG: hypothetical protein PSV18_10420 [Methylobacter sp.]|nr:hypothetical protein [Candidatus Methylobacter titanis]